MKVDLIGAIKEWEVVVNLYMKTFKGRVTFLKLCLLVPGTDHS